MNEVFEIAQRFTVLRDANWIGTYARSELTLPKLAAVLGGTSAGGGYGKVIGVMLAIVMLQMLASGLNLLGVDPFFAIAIWGAILLLVMTLKHLLRQRA